MPMMRRRRPLLRTAAIGGGAFMAGKKMAQHAASGAQPEQGAGAAGTAGTQAAGQPGGPDPATAGGTGAAGDTAAAGGAPMADQLQQISALHQQGALTDAEFAAAKAKLLGS